MYLFIYFASSSRGSRALTWPLLVPHACGKDIRAFKIPIHITYKDKITFKRYFNIFKENKMRQGSTAYQVKITKQGALTLIKGLQGRHYFSIVCTSEKWLSNWLSPGKSKDMTIKYSGQLLCGSQL